MPDDDSKATEQAVAAFFHMSRAEAKERKRNQPKGNPPLHHRANTDWWNHVPGGKKR